jgi:hypothetical protein
MPEVEDLLARDAWTQDMGKDEAVSGNIEAKTIKTAC